MQTQPVSVRQFDETKQELARLKAEVERLTQVIKVTGSNVTIEATTVSVNGSIYLSSNGQGFLRVNSKSYFEGTTYGRNTHFTIF